MLGRDDEFVYDDLEGRVVDAAKKIENKQIKDSSETLADITVGYIELLMSQDHEFSFGGLSGGPTVNEKGELVGINSSEVQAYLELTDRGLIYHPWTTFHLVPASELEKLMPLIANIE